MIGDGGIGFCSFAYNFTRLRLDASIWSAVLNRDKQWMCGLVAASHILSSFLVTV
jgi:hypothetical protein